MKAHKDKKLRTMLVDCLRYCRDSPCINYWIKRKDIEVHEDTIETSYLVVSLADLIEGIEPEKYSKVFVRGKSCEDYDGCRSSEVEIYTYRKQTDLEYFDTICGYFLPTEYQNNQYETYLRLKKQFEG